MVASIVCALMIPACTTDTSFGPIVSDEAAPDTGPAISVVSAEPVLDLSVRSRSESTLTMSWTEVDDGTGAPASYRLRYGPTPTSWNDGAVGCDATITGSAIGATRTCVVEGLEAAASYDLQLMSYRAVGGKWHGATYSNLVTATTPAPAAGPAPVGDLYVSEATPYGLVVRWTQIDDGTGEPASYRVKVAEPPIDWSSAATACTIEGTVIGDEASCMITALDPDRAYEVLLMSFRSEPGGGWADARYSNVASGRTEVDEYLAGGIWVSRGDLASLPTSGPAWANLVESAGESCGPVDLADQEQATNVCVMAKALVFARTGAAPYLDGVLAAIGQIVNAPPYRGRALALGRELGAYAIAADLVDLGAVAPALDAAFRTTLRTLLTTPTVEGPGSLIECHEVRPNNWGTHCGGSRAAVAAYLGDEAELARVAQVFKGWLGDRTSYAGFHFGDLSWQCDADRPVGINPRGCVRSGVDVDGALPDDQRRGGGLASPPPHEGYVWEALQGALLQAVVLDRAGYPAFEWGDRALLRAFEWLHEVAGFPAEGDDTWQPHVINGYYGTSFPAPLPARAGKNVGWTDWTHGG